jgi:hypothetical protein
MFGRTHSESAKQKMSEAKAKLIADGKFRAYGTRNMKGWHFSFKAGECFYRSSWELCMMKWLDSNNDVTTWQHEKIRLPYYYDEHKRWYVPDFLITFSDGGRVLCEIKPKQFINDVKTVAKQSAARDWCVQNNVRSVVILTKEMMVSLGVDMTARKP